MIIFIFKFCIWLVKHDHSRYLSKSYKFMCSWIWKDIFLQNEYPLFKILKWISRIITKLNFLQCHQDTIWNNAIFLCIICNFKDWAETVKTDLLYIILQMYKIAVKICKNCSSFARIIYLSIYIIIEILCKTNGWNPIIRNISNFRNNSKSNTNVCKRVTLLGFLYKFCTYLCGHVRGIGILNPKQHLTKNPWNWSTFESAYSRIFTRQSRYTILLL